MMLALTRGLLPAPVVNQRHDCLFDTFEWSCLTAFWFKHCRDIPIGCAVFTDGSLIDQKIGYGCQSLGWAFAIVDDEGDLVASAQGVPPRWIETIQGAELWAVRMALEYAIFPSVLLTDCMTVQKGLRRPSEWVKSSKRKLSRVWQVVHDQLEGQDDIIHWMPAHTSKSSIGQKLCSDSKPVCDIRWTSNQLVDLMAKSAAESCRVPAVTRNWLRQRDKQVSELAKYIGLLTYAVNHFPLADGTFTRDSDPLPKRQRTKRRGRKHS
jgi:ribonuclease HI